MEGLAGARATEGTNRPDQICAARCRPLFVRGARSVVMKPGESLPVGSAALEKEVSPRARGLFLKNLGDFQTELARIHAGFVPAVANWQHRKELPALIFRSLRRVQDLRVRGRELGVSFQEMHLSRQVAGR